MHTPSLFPLWNNTWQLSDMNIFIVSVTQQSCSSDRARVAPGEAAMAPSHCCFMQVPCWGSLSLCKSPTDHSFNLHTPIGDSAWSRKVPAPRKREGSRRRWAAGSRKPAVKPRVPVGQLHGCWLFGCPLRPSLIAVKIGDRGREPGSPQPPMQRFASTLSCWPPVQS